MLVILCNTRVLYFRIFSDKPISSHLKSSQFICRFQAENPSNFQPEMLREYGRFFQPSQLTRRSRSLEAWEKMVKGDAGTSQHSVLVVIVLMSLFNVCSLPLMFYVVEIVGLFCP